MIRAKVISEVYVPYSARPTRRSTGEDYNPGMETIRALRRLFRAVPSPVADALLALGMTVYIATQGAFDHGPGDGSGPSLLALALPLLITLPLALRRRLPLPAFIVMTFGVSVTFTSGVTAHPALVWGAVVALLIASYSVGMYSSQSFVSAVVLLGTATIIVIAFGGGLPAPPDFAVPFVVVGVPWLVAHALRSRQLRADAFEEKAGWLERAQESATQVALARERARIARELHDVVAHSVSVMVVQAGAARQLLRPDQRRAGDALLAVEGSGREAMSELRNLLGLLHTEGDESNLAPQPGLDQAESLVQRVRDARLPVVLRVLGSPYPLPPGVDLTAYRILQEALTNALKYSDLARTEVILDYRSNELKVEVLDDGPGRPPSAGLPLGRGLVGMRERVSIYGGTLEAGPRLERGFAVRAWLPLGRDLS